MKYEDYLKRFEGILNAAEPQPPYDEAAYFMFARLNHARMIRWYKTAQLSEELVSELQKIDAPQTWLIIAEPWCGDAAPTVPFLVRLAEQNPLIRHDIQLRDEEPFVITSYLTNGTKSIPKMVVRDEEGNDLFNWGPRPKEAQQFADELKSSGMSHDNVKAELQVWYNKDKGTELQKELLPLFASVLRGKAGWMPVI